MCDHVWIFEARTLSTQPVRRRCGMCGVYRLEPRCREPGTLVSAVISSMSASPAFYVVGFLAAFLVPTLAVVLVV
jgi:hypothetical protein